MEFELKIKKVSPLLDQAINLPKYATSGSAGLDLCACIEEPVIIDVNEVKAIPTGIAIELPSNNLAGFVFARSGLASKHGICLVNGVGVIDSDYRGEIICVLENRGKEKYKINPGDRIAQIVFMPIALAKLKIVDQLSATERGEGGFGSSGL